MTCIVYKRSSRKRLRVLRRLLTHEPAASILVWSGLQVDVDQRHSPYSWAHHLGKARDAGRRALSARWRTNWLGNWNAASLSIWDEWRPL